MKIIQNDDKLSHIRFDHLEELLELAEKGKGRDNHRTYAESFNGHVSWKDSVKLIQNGWPEGLKDVVELSGIAVGGSVQRKGRKKKANYFGKTVNLDRYLREEPRAFIHPQRAPHKIPAVKIGVQVSAPGALEKQGFTNRGAVTLSLACKLEESGVPVEIWLFSYGEEYGSRKKGQLLEVCAKRADQPLDADKLAYLSSHCAFFRQQWFGLYGYISREVEDNNYRINNHPVNKDLSKYGNRFYDVSPPFGYELLSDWEACKKWAQETADKLTGESVPA